jgi:hypothetical protein
VNNRDHPRMMKEAAREIGPDSQRRGRQCQARMREGEVPEWKISRGKA